MVRALEIETKAAEPASKSRLQEAFAMMSHAYFAALPVARSNRAVICNRAVILYATPRGKLQSGCYMPHRIVAGSNLLHASFAHALIGLLCATPQDNLGCWLGCPIRVEHRRGSVGNAPVSL